MTKKPSNHRKKWTGDEKQLRGLAKQGKSTPQIAKILKRTENAVYSKASELGITLMPIDL